MILTPKNWKSFQHYKDRSPAWIKLHKGLLDDFDFACLPVASRALAPCLWLLASEYEDGQINMSLDALAFRLRMTRGDLADALNPLIEGGFFDASEPLADSKPDACLEKEREKSKRREDIRSPSAPKVDDDFENLKKVYPRRKGNYGWKAAERKFNSLVKTGVDPKAIIAAAKRLGETLSARVGTEFIPMPASWLNSEDFLDLAVTAFDQPVDDGMIQILNQQQLDAWDAYGRKVHGKSYPRDKRGGWRFPSKWPPGYENEMVSSVMSLVGAAK